MRYAEITEQQVEWQTWWFHPRHGVVSLPPGENQHWFYVIDHYKEMGIDIEQILTRYANPREVYDDDDDWYAIKRATYDAGWARIGLVEHVRGYVDSASRNTSLRASRWLDGKTGAVLAKLDLLMVNRSRMYALAGDDLARYLDSGILFPRNEVHSE